MLFATLPISRPCVGLRSDSRRAHYHSELRAVGGAAGIFAPCHFGCVGSEVLASNMMVCADFSAADAAKEALSGVGVRAVLRVSLLVIDTLYREVSGQLVPMSSLVSMDGCASLDVGAGQGHALSFVRDNTRERAAFGFAHGDNDLALAGLVNFAAAILAIFAAVGRLHIASEVRAIDLHVTGERAFVASKAYCFAELVEQHEGRLVIAAEVTGELERAVAFGAVHEDGDCAENVAKAELAAVKDGAGRDRELFATAFALPDRTAFQVIVLKTSALRADRLTIRVSPAELSKRLRGFVIGHAKHFRERERLGGGGEEEVLSHNS